MKLYHILLNMTSQIRIMFFCIFTYYAHLCQRAINSTFSKSQPVRKFTQHLEILAPCQNEKILNVF